jgi:hypothetical protein
MDVVDNIKYAVIKGGQNVTPSQFRAISTSNNQLVFNIQVPSEQTLIDRRCLLQTDLTLQVTSTQFTYASGGAATAVGAHGCGYGISAGLAPYPLHQLMTVASSTINNNTVSINIRDVLPAIIRMLDKEELGAYNGMSATATDSLLNYGDTAYGVAPALGANQTLNTDFAGRGSIYLLNYSSSAVVAGVVTETFTWRIAEPLMLSPWIYCNPKSNAQAFYGIQNMNIVLNIGDLSRVFRGCGPPQNVTAAGVYSVGASLTQASPAGSVPPASAAYPLPWITNVQPGTTGDGGSMFSKTFLFFTFLTAHPSDLFPARNIVPYYELPRYITQQVNQAVATPSVKVSASNNYWISGIDTSQGTQFTSQTLQLNQIPDKLLIYLRKQGQSWYDSDAYLPITNISIDFNNNSGILSAARNVDLYRMSKDNGSNQSFNEWVGFQTCGVAGIVAQDGLPRPSAMATSALTAPSFATIPTCGSCLVLEFGKDIQLIEDFFAPGSLGNFNIRVNVYYQNNNVSITTASTIEMVMITMNSGVFVCERGTSSTYTGILTRADVLEASEQDAYTRSDVKRLVGGGFLDMLKSGVSKLAPLAKAILPHAHEYLKDKGALGQAASAAMKHAGYGMSAGGMSGGRLSGRYQ